MKNKKLIATILMLAMASMLVLTACGDDASTNQGAASPTNTGTAPANTGQASPTPGNTGQGSTTPGSTEDPNDPNTQIGLAALDYAAFVKSEIRPNAVSSRDTFTFAAVRDPGMITTWTLRDLSFYPLSTSAQQYFMLYDYEIGAYFSPVLDKYEPDPDFMGVTFYIKPGIKMHDGGIFGPYDLIMSIQAFRDHNSSGWHLDFVILEEAEIIDDTTIHFPFNRLNGVWASGFEMLTVISGAAYEAAGRDVDFYQKPVGPMPYYVAEWIPGESITLERFDDYFQGTPPIKTIKMVVISDRTAAFMALQNGDIDLLWALSADQVKTANANDNLELIMTGRNMMIFMGMNSGNAALSDFRVRQALFHAVNRDDIIKGAYDGLATPANSIVTQEGIGYNTDYEQNSPFPEYSVEKAKELLADAGYGNGLTLRILAESSINFQLVVEQLAAQLGEVGITLEPTLTDSASVNTIIAGNDESAYDMYLYVAKASGEAISTIDNFALFGATRPQLSADGSGVRYAELWDNVRSKPDINERAEAYKLAQANFFENGLYWIPLAVSQTYIGLDKDLTGIRILGFQGYFSGAYFR